jgi:putative oxidoreductase
MTPPCRWRRTALFAGRILLGTVFIAAAVTKIADPAAFARGVYQYHLLPDGLISLVAVFLPWLELTAGGALLFIPKLRDASAAVLAALLLIFAVAIAFNLCRGLEAPCGCFDALIRIPVGWGHVAGDVCLAAVAFMVCADSWRAAATPSRA